MITVRSETLGVPLRVHVSNAGAGLMPISVLHAMTEHLQREADTGSYNTAVESAEARRI
jgi:cysteine desulfurase / selenocysteine lyase